MFLRLVFVCIMFVPVTLFSRSADAVPPFARKYKTSCTTCHWIAWPKLNPFGRAFRARGYRIPPEDEIYVKDEPVVMGAEPWKRLFPFDAMWPTDIPGMPPVGIGFDAEFTKKTQINKGETAFNGIGEIELFTGGTLGESFSWFGVLALFENEGAFEESKTNIDRWFGIYTPQFFDWTPGFLNIRFGQFEPRAVPFSNHRRILRIRPYLADIFPVVPTGNFFGFSPNQKGIELFGAMNGPGGRGGFEWAVGLVNGEVGGALGPFKGVSGMPGSIATQVGEEWEGAANAFDINNAKDWYVRLSYKLGGMGVLGGVSEEPLTSTKNWRDEKFTPKISAFVYRGTQGYFRNLMDLEGSFKNKGNRFWRFGAEMDFFLYDFNIFGGATFFRDRTDQSVTMGSQEGDTFNVNIYTAEVDYVALPWLVPAFRWEYVDPNYDVMDTDAFHRYSFDLSVMLRANTKVLLGGSWSEENLRNITPNNEIWRTAIEIDF